MAVNPLLIKSRLYYTPARFLCVVSGRIRAIYEELEREMRLKGRERD